MANIGGRIRPFLHDYQVGELAGFQGSDVSIESDIFGTVQRAALEGFHGSHATLDETPDFPVGTNAVELSMSACLHEAPLVVGSFSDGGYFLMVEVIFVSFHASSGARLQNVWRYEILKAGMHPEISFSVPIVFTPQPTVSN